MRALTLGLAALAGLFSLAACAPAEVPLTEPWLSMEIPVETAAVLESRPTRLTLSFERGLGDEDAEGAYVSAVERRAERLGYTRGDTVDSNFVFDAEGNRELRMRIQPGRRSSTLVTFELQGTLPALLPVHVSWAGEASVHDVLGTQSQGGPQAVAVPRRPPSAAGVRAAGSAFPDYVVTTRCGKGYCVDGLRTSSKEEIEQLVVEGSLTGPEQEVLLEDPDRSWVERGIKVVEVGTDFVSYYEASAAFAAGAAHSDASLSCRTLQRRFPIATLRAPGKKDTIVHSRLPATLVGPFTEVEAARIQEAVRWFIEDRREDGDLRAATLELPGDIDFLLDADSRDVLFCLRSTVEADAGHVQLVRARLGTK